MHEKHELGTIMATNRGLQLLNKLAGEGRTAFTAAEVRSDLDLSRQAPANLLTRLTRAGFLDRVSGGRYAIPPLGALGTVAAWDDLGSAVAAVFAGYPHRIGFLTALGYRTPEEVYHAAPASRLRQGSLPSNAERRNAGSHAHL